MKSQDDILRQAADDLQREGTDITFLRRSAEVIPHVVDKSQIEAAVAEFHNAAGGCPYWQDSDVGALILEHVADDLPVGDLKEFLYRHALYRARWCAAAATAGGEGRARFLHVRELEAKWKAQPSAGGIAAAPRASA